MQLRSMDPDLEKTPSPRGLGTAGAVEGLSVSHTLCGVRYKGKLEQKREGEKGGADRGREGEVGHGSVRVGEGT